MGEIPGHFDPKDTARVFRVPYAARADEARLFAEAHRIAPAAEDRRRVGLLLVDVQNTFCLPEFELFVAGRSGTGAIDDNARLCSFLYRNLGAITEVVATLDTHGPLQIFHPAFWVDERGQHPAPHTKISVREVESGRWRINPQVAAVLPALRSDAFDYARHYVRRLEEGGKFPLTIWPYHAILGGLGHALVSSVEEAVFFHQIARSAPARFVTKGQHPLTENYSVLEPEVDVDPRGHPLVGRDEALVDRLLGFDLLVVAGQAKSHCVAWTVADLLTEIERREPGLASRIRLLDDCSSAVCVPGVVDYTDSADAAYRRFAAAGMQVVRSVDLDEELRRPA
ncbi:MAG TPA: isochorismatase [Vicinamibacteria bacterium]